MIDPSLISDAGDSDALSYVTAASSIQQRVQPRCAENVTELTMKTEFEIKLENARKNLGIAMQSMTKAETHFHEAETELSEGTLDGGWFGGCWKLGKKRDARLALDRAERRYLSSQLQVSEARALKNEIESQARDRKHEIECQARDRKHETTDTMLGKMREQLDTVVRTLASTSPSALDAWESKLPAEIPRIKGLRKIRAVDYDVCEVLANGSVIAKCFLTGEKGNRDVVTLTHLLPRNTPKHFAEKLGIEDIDCTRNVIFLCKNIEKAYDEKKLCFLADPNNSRSFLLKIWEKKTKRTVLFENSKQVIGDFDGKAMVFPEGKTPFSRVLSEHARLSYNTARDMRWIDQNEPAPDEYGSPLQDDTLTFEQVHRSATSPTGSISLPSRSPWQTPQRSSDSDGGSQQSLDA